jgi:drug/metabolite transporter (DMT)-like permease
MEKNQRKALLFGLSAVFFWSTVASAFKLSLKHLSITGLLFYASLTSTAVLFIILLIQGKTGELKSCSKRDILSSALLGFLNPFIYYLILFKAYSLLPAQQAQPLNYTWGIILVLLSIPILKQKIRAKDIIAMFISFFGIVIIATGGKLTALGFESPLGVGLALISSFLWALYWIFNTKDKRDPVVKLFLNFCFGLLFITAAYFLFGNPTFPSVYGLLGGLYVGLFEMGITFVLWLAALKLATTTAHVSILIYLSPFLSFIFINIFVGEKILPASIIGLGFIITGILVQRWDNLFNKVSVK